MWIWQEEFEGFESLDCHVEYDPDDSEILCRVPSSVPNERLSQLAGQIDKARARIVRDVGFRTVMR